MRDRAIVSNVRSVIGMARRDTERRTAAVVALGALSLALALPGRTPRIRRGGPTDRDGIAALEKVTLGDAEQSVLIRSENTDNPILLFLHGGPGTSELTLNRRNTRVLERSFTVVNWDQRGAGKSYRAGRDRSRMHISQFVADAVDLSIHLAHRFGREKVTLVGHSWGSVIGMLAVSRRPDLFDAYVGIGQVSNAAEGERISYD